MKGRFYWAKRIPEYTKKALGFYQQAIEKDPNYALAYAGVSDCYANLGFTPYGAMPATEAGPRAKAAAQKALALDPSLGEAHASLGLCANWYDWDWAAAERAFRRSIDLAPDSLGARVWYPVMLATIGREEEAYREGQQLLKIDPLSVNAITAFSQALFVMKRFDECESVIQKALEIDRNYPTALTFLALVLLTRNQLADADALQARIQIESPYFRAQKAWFHAAMGRRNNAVQILEELNVRARTSYVSPTIFSLVYMGLGDVEGSKKYLQLSFDERDPLLLFLLVDPAVDFIGIEAFAEELRRKVGVPKKRLHSKRSLRSASVKFTNRPTGSYDYATKRESDRSRPQLGLFRIWSFT